MSAKVVVFDFASSRFFDSMYPVFPPSVDLLVMIPLYRNFKLLRLEKFSGYKCFLRGISGKYIQGFSPKEGVREYFYYIDHQGQLFLEGTKIRNFVTCYKDVEFLTFFFKRLKLNSTGALSEDFPYVSRCGPEINYIRCESRPIVFTDVINIDNESRLVINGIGDKMTVPFNPEGLCMLPRNGRVYHPAAKKVGGCGILKTSLAIQFSSNFLYENDVHNDDDPPTHFIWNDQTFTLHNELWDVLKGENVEED